MTEKKMIEKFSTTELANLRGELLSSALDSWQAAAVVCTFLAGRGYGFNSEHVRDVVSRLETPGFCPERMQEALERVAYYM